MSKIRQPIGVEVPGDIEPSYTRLVEIMTAKPQE
jgi:hypothetical protein